MLLYTPSLEESEGRDRQQLCTLMDDHEDVVRSSDAQNRATCSDAWDQSWDQWYQQAVP
jgi:hypothetical protein